MRDFLIQRRLGKIIAQNLQRLGEISNICGIDVNIVRRLIILAENKKQGNDLKN
jgi:hypothetical protein